MTSLNMHKLYFIAYRFTTYQDARRVRLVDGLLKQIFYEYHPLSCILKVVFGVIKFEFITLI